jgi:hypothetical protein
MGLGEKGKQQVRNGAASGLFAKTEPVITEIHDYENTEILKNIQTEPCISEQKKHFLRKTYDLSLPLAERLRQYAFDSRSKETEVVRKALDEWLKKQGY